MATSKRDFTSNEDIIKTGAKNIRKYRKEKNVTQEQLEFDIILSLEFYKKFESTLGNEDITVNMYKISSFLR